MAPGEGEAAMKRVLSALVPALVLCVAAGCDLTDVPSDAKAVLTAQGVDPVAVGDQLQTRLHLRLMDGSCTGDGSQYRYQNRGAGGGNGGNGAGGQGDGQQLRLRDGSCGDVDGK